MLNTSRTHIKLCAPLALSFILLAGCSEPTPTTDPKRQGPTEATTTDKPHADGMPNPAKTVTGLVKDGVFVNKDGTALCPVGGEAISVTDGVANETVDGVKYYFCMPACTDYFTKDTAKFALAKGETTKEVPTTMP